MMKGKCSIGYTYGYDKTKVGNETVITINEEQAQVVRRIYQMHLDCMSNNAIAGELTKRGIKTYFGIEDHHPAIISQEVFDRAQEGKNKNRKETKPQSSNPNALSRRIHCGNCGQNITRNRIHPWYYFWCVSAITSKSICSFPTIREDLMLEIMLKAFRVRFEMKDPKLIKILQRMLVRINQNDNFEFHCLKA